MLNGGKSKILLFALAFAVALPLSGPRAACAADDAGAPRPSAGCKAPEIQHGRRLQRAIEVDGSQRSYILDVPDQVKASIPCPAARLPRLRPQRRRGVERLGVSRPGGAGGFHHRLPRRPAGEAPPAGRGVRAAGLGDRLARFEPRPAVGVAPPRPARADVLRRPAPRVRHRLLQRRLLQLDAGLRDAGPLRRRRSGERRAAVGSVRPRARVPILIQHGSKDDVVPVELAHQARDAWIAVDACAESATEGTCEVHTECRNGAVVEYCEEAYPHAWPPSATARIWEFFRAHPMP